MKDAASLPAAKAYAALKAQVRESRSIRLAALAVKVRTAKVARLLPKAITVWTSVTCYDSLTRFT